MSSGGNGNHISSLRGGGSKSSLNPKASSYFPTQENSGTSSPVLGGPHLERKSSARSPGNRQPAPGGTGSNNSGTVRSDSLNFRITPKQSSSTNATATTLGGSRTSYSVLPSGPGANPVVSQQSYAEKAQQKSAVQPPSTGGNSPKITDGDKKRAVHSSRVMLEEGGSGPNVRLPNMNNEGDNNMNNDDGTAASAVDDSSKSGASLAKSISALGKPTPSKDSRGSTMSDLPASTGIGRPSNSEIMNHRESIAVVQNEMNKRRWITVNRMRYYKLDPFNINSSETVTKAVDFRPEYDFLRLWDLLDMQQPESAQLAGYVSRLKTLESQRQKHKSGEIKTAPTPMNNILPYNQILKNQQQKQQQQKQQTHQPQIIPQMISPTPIMPVQLGAPPHVQLGAAGLLNNPAAVPATGVNYTTPMTIRSANALTAAMPVPSFQDSWNTSLKNEDYSLVQMMSVYRNCVQKLKNEGLFEGHGIIVTPLDGFGGGHSGPGGWSSSHHHDAADNFHRGQKSNQQYGGAGASGGAGGSYKKVQNQYQRVALQKKIDEEVENMAEEDLGLGSSMKRRDKTSDLKVDKEVRMKVLKGVLNKLSVDTFEKSSQTLKDVVQYHSDFEELTAIAKEIYFKAISEVKQYSEIYADLIDALFQFAPIYVKKEALQVGKTILTDYENYEKQYDVLTEKKRKQRVKNLRQSQKELKQMTLQDFRRIFIIEIQNAFDSIWEYCDLTAEEKQLSKEERDVVKSNKAQKMRNNMKFLGELYIREGVSYALLAKLVDATIPYVIDEDQSKHFREIAQYQQGQTNPTDPEELLIEKNNLIVTVFCELFEQIGQFIHSNKSSGDKEKNSYKTWIASLKDIKDKYKHLTQFSRCKIDELVKLVDDQFQRKKLLVSNLIPQSIDVLNEQEKLRDHYQDKNPHSRINPATSFNDVIKVGKRADHPYKAYLKELHELHKHEELNPFTLKLRSYFQAEESAPGEGNRFVRVVDETVGQKTEPAKSDSVSKDNKNTNAAAVAIGSPSQDTDGTPEDPKTKR